MADLSNALELETSLAVTFDAQRQAVRGIRRVGYRDLVLEEKPTGNVEPVAAAALLAERADAQFEQVFQPDKAGLRWLDRLRFAARHLPEEDWPDVSEAGLRAHLKQQCAGKRKFEELRRIDWAQVLTAEMQWPQRQLLDREVPDRWQVPSGTHITIDYAPAFSDTDAPVLAVRLQELFGLAETPRVAKGRVPLLLHLLGPNMRPVQVTRDLRGFWDTTYAEVRKELRRRYPKHAWPENPWTATPIRGVPRRKK
jgi:ATP-dependent helicase HrpB